MKRPLLVYDGDCGFCRAAAQRGMRWTGGAVDFAPFQEVADRFPHISRAAFAEAVFLIEPGGRTTRAGEAVLRALEWGGHARGARLYRASRWFRLLCEAAYRWVAAHRAGLGRWLGLRACRVDPDRGRMRP